MKQLQAQIIENKKRHGFNTTDIKTEFLYLYGEVAEAYDAWLKNKDDLNEELADIAIYLFGLAEILDLDLGKEIEKKMAKNEKRVYEKIDGVMTRISDGDEKS